MLPLTHDDHKVHKNSRICYICKNPFKRNPENEVNGKLKIIFIQVNIVVHSKCNLAYKFPKYIPVIFHNLNDAHIIICELGKQFSNENIGVFA